MSGERQAVEMKSLRLISGRNLGFDEIACECVGFANARGVHLHLRIEDRAETSRDGKSYKQKSLKL
jgi:ATP-dependent DNA helicase RecG